MPPGSTEVTEIATALGMLAPELDEALAHRPAELSNVPDATWDRLVDAWRTGQHAESFATAFANGRAFLAAQDALRGRHPLRIEWKGPHQPPGDDVIPADLRVDHVYLVSCKYLSKVMLNPGPQRLFERLLVGDGRDGTHWFLQVAGPEFQALYEAAVAARALSGFPAGVADLDRAQQRELKEALAARTVPAEMQEPWRVLCDVVSARTAQSWKEALDTPRARLHLLWRLLRIATAAYFVLGTDRTAHLRLRVDSAWDWMQAFELRSFEVFPRRSGQPEVGWRAVVRTRAGGSDVEVSGHVEIRWSHGRFYGVPEAKVYLDTPHRDVPGYHPLAEPLSPPAASDRLFEL